ncbi:unnamed protein product [Heligmosomoides polygyrus]|uniref:WD_REPEATS_REGION domain-containing protein n=1 Tax=Heligmosomoides polygyrus TaxID=6339 RepID=A0A3P8C4X9_HELPZ|nr:unnamed protein product [Heligmosomoides polygyrus]
MEYATPNQRMTHKKDPRMVVSAGNDGFARVFNPDNGEILGAVQLQQNDRARAITWSEARPDLLAIQYHQHATEFRSIETGSENATVGPLQVSMVPQWVSAAPVGSSFAMGGRMATHYRQWDEAKQIWRYTVEVKKVLWTFLAALSNKQGRREFVRILGFGGNEARSKDSRASRTSVTSNEVTQLTNIMSSLNNSSPRTVVEKLLAQKDYATAFMLARDNANLMHRITEKYIAEELAAPQRLLSLIATDGFDQLVDTFPREQWSQQDAVHAAFAAVLAQDVDLLLASNRSYSSEERAKQAMVLRSLTGADVNEEFEKLLYTYCEDLIAGGVSDAAWRILSKVNTKDERLLSLRHDLFLICGGEERTMNKEPENPRSRQVSQQRNPVFTPSAAVAPLHHHSRPAYPPAAQPSGMTPTFSNSSYGGYVPTPAPPMPGTPPLSSYQSGYYAPTPPPPVPMPPPVPGYQPAAAASMYTSQPTAVPGFSQAPAPLPPPPVAPPNVPTGSSYGYPASHAQQSFAPPVPAPTAQAYSQSSINWKPLEQAPVSIPNGLPGAISGTPIRPPSSASSHHPPEHKEIPQLSLTIRQLLWQCAEQSSHGNYRGATAICGQMVRTGGDFVEGIGSMFRAGTLVMPIAGTAAAQAIGPCVTSSVAAVALFCVFGLAGGPHSSVMDKHTLAPLPKHMPRLSHAPTGHDASSSLEQWSGLRPQSSSQESLPVVE